MQMTIELVRYIAKTIIIYCRSFLWIDRAQLKLSFHYLFYAGEEQLLKERSM